MSTTPLSPALKTKAILLADDEEVTLNLVREGLELISPAWRVNGVDSLQSLRFCINDRHLGLVICNLALDAATTEQLSAEIVDHHPRLPVILITDVTSQALTALTRSHPHWMIFSRPVEFEHVAAVAEDFLESRAHSRIEGFNLVSFLQLMELDRKTGTLRITAAARRGVVCFREGNPTYAATRDAEGEQALVEILGWQDPSIRVFNHVETDAENLNRSLKGLLLDGCQQIDEQSRSLLPGDRT